jgi:glycine betaine/proline transport system ATP-binding protein
VDVAHVELDSGREEGGMTGPAVTADRPESAAARLQARDVKLSCRRIWKVYGPSPGRELSSIASDEPTDVRLARLRADNNIPAVADVSFDILSGEIFVIMGLSGSGKSTLVRCLSRLIEPTSGEILLDGKDLLKFNERELIELRRHTMGMVFQSFGLLPHLTVLDNVAFPLRLQGRPVSERRRRAQEMISLVGLEGREASYPHQLSGGQQQRVGIARSLAVGPELWFLDEPFSALDPLIRKQMQEEFLRLQRLLKKTIVFITHDIVEAFRLADRLAIMRDGRIIQIGRPAEIVLAPADEYVAAFTEDVPLLRVITAGDLAEPDAARPAGTGDVLERVPANWTLEQLVPRLARGCGGFEVIGERETMRGYLSAARALAVLARDEVRRSSQ